MMNNLTQKDMVKNVALDLCNANNTVTTLEIKNRLRKQYPGSWYQSEISTLMMDLADENEFDYQDNGLFRVYSIYDPNKHVQIQTVSKPIKIKTPIIDGGTIDQTQAKDLIENSGSKFFSVYDSYFGLSNGRYNTQTGKIEFRGGGSVNLNYLEGITKLSINRTVYDVK